MTRLLLMHSIAIITAVCLLATPTEAPWSKHKAMMSSNPKYPVRNSEERNELVDQMQNRLQDIEQKIGNLKRKGLTKPRPQNAAAIHALEGDVLHNYLDGFDLWWRDAVHPEVIKKEMCRWRNVERVRNALRPIVHEDNTFSDAKTKRSVKWLLDPMEGEDQDAVKDQMRNIFLSNFKDAGNLLHHRLATCPKDVKRDSLEILGEVEVWVENMEKLTIGAFKHDFRKLKHCHVNPRGHHFHTLSAVATYIASDAFNCVKDHLKEHQTAANYKAFEFRLKILRLLGQIHEQWSKLHELSKACYNTPERVAGHR